MRHSVKVGTTNTGAVTISVNGLLTKSLKKLDGVTALVSSDLVAGQVIEVEYDGTNYQLLTPVADAPVTLSILNAAVKFGGTGADGALNVSSGTTVIDLGNARYFEKNYTSVNITGTGAVTFTNPSKYGTVIRFNTTGHVNITSTAPIAIDLRNLGGQCEYNATRDEQLSYGDLAGQTIGKVRFYAAGNYSANFGGGGGSYFPGTRGYRQVQLNGQGGRQFTATPSNLEVYAGGAGGWGIAEVGSTYAGANVAGGTGAGSLVIACKGIYTFTGNITGTGGAGAVGANGVFSEQGGISGGGGGSIVLVVANTIGTNTGTTVLTGGIGGNSVSPEFSGGNGGNGIYIAAVNTYFT
jgi:hypothetical protein